MAVFFAITGAMTAVGPIAGGYLTVWTWRAIFWVNVPIAVAAFLIVAFAARPSVRRSERIDFRGALIVAAGMGLVVFGLQQASPWGWGSAAVIASLVLGAALLALFVVLQRRTAEPLVRIAAFRDRGFALSTVATLFASIAFIATFFFLSVYGQVSLRLSAAETGLLFLKFFIGFVVASRIGSVRFDKHGARTVVLLGGLVGAVGFGWLAVSATELSFHAEAFFNPQTWPILVAGAGIGLMFSPVSTDAVNRAVGASYGEVSAITQTMKNFGGALGLAIFTTVVTSRLTDLLTASFTRIGGSAADAQNAVERISGASGSGGSLASLPQAVQEQIMHAVRTDYASAVQWAFWGMAAAMAIVALVGVFYPAGRTSVPDEDGRTDGAGRTGQDAGGVEPTERPATV
jgi:predicted MFS family arabinose efflux permease